MREPRILTQRDLALLHEAIGRELLARLAQEGRTIEDLTQTDLANRRYQIHMSLFYGRSAGESQAKQHALYAALDAGRVPTLRSLSPREAVTSVTAATAAEHESPGAGDWSGGQGSSNGAAMRLPENQLEWTKKDFQRAYEATVELAAALDASARLGDLLLHVWGEYPSAGTFGDFEAALHANPEMAADVAAEETALRRVARAQDDAIALGLIGEDERTVTILKDGTVALKRP